MASPPDRVPTLINDLLSWLKSSKDHLLIRSCVFHYEFEFIHPFVDGNGRMGRLWQSLILGKLHPLFEHLPLENMVYANQQSYYNAITESTNAGESGPFIDFMLEEIYNTLKIHQGAALKESNVDSLIDQDFANIFGREFGVRFGINEKQILLHLEKTPTSTASELSQNMGITQRAVEKIIKKLKRLRHHHPPWQPEKWSLGSE